MITQPYPSFIDPEVGGRAKPVSNGTIFIGQNQKDPIQFPEKVYYTDDNGTEIEMDQPIYLNSAGVTVASKNSSTVVRPYTKSASYSILIRNSGGHDRYANDSVSGFATEAWVESGEAEITATGSTTPRALKDRFADVVNVEDFGAVGDGIQDDTNAIQAAIDSVSNVGFTKITGLGTYNTSTININNKSNLLISLKTITKTNGIRTFYVTNSYQIHFKDCGLLGADDFNGSPGNAVGVDFEFCEECSVNDSKIEKYGNGGIRYKDSNNLWFTKNILEGPTGISEGDNYSFGIYTFAQTLGSNGIFITNNRLNGWAQGVFGSLVENITLTGNIITDVQGQHAFYIEPKNHCVVTGNIVVNPAYNGIKVQVQASSSTGETHKGVVITGNTVMDSGQAGIIVSTVAGLTEYFIGTTITGNTIFGCQTGIYTDKVIQVNISNNQLSGSAAYGIYCENTDGVIEGNLIHDTYWGGIVLWNMRDTVSVTDNKLSYVAKAADATKGERNSAIFSTGTYDVKLSGNSYYRDGTTASYSVFSTTSNYYLLGGNDFPLDAPIRITNLMALNDIKRGAIYGVYSPETPVFGLGGRHFHASTTPSSGTYYKGDVIWNISPDAGGVAGWMCISTSSSGGEWRSFGELSM